MRQNTHGPECLGQVIEQVESENVEERKRLRLVQQQGALMTMLPFLTQAVRSHH